MRIVVPKETKAGELRVALVPDIIFKLTNKSTEGGRGLIDGKEKKGEGLWF